jgi:hypothetical protein
MFEESERPLSMFKKHYPYMTGRFLKKKYFLIMNFVKNFVMKNLGLDPDPDWIYSATG